MKQSLAKAYVAIVLSILPALQAEAQTLHYDRPAQYFEEALVIGNGTMGGIVYGGTQKDLISLNDITLWTGEPCNMNVYSPEAYKSIPLIREALKQDDYKEADRLQRDVQGHFSQNYQPLGQHWQCDGSHGISTWRLSLYNGVFCHKSRLRNCGAYLDG